MTLREPPAVVRSMNSAMTSRASWRLSKSCRYRHSSLRVRMNRSATPLHSGSPMYEGVERIPQPLQLPLELVGRVLWAPVVP